MCSPALASEGLSIEPELGLLMPCTAVVRVDDHGRTAVAGLAPRVLMALTGRPELAAVSEEAAARLDRVLDAVETTAPL